MYHLILPFSFLPYNLLPSKYLIPLMAWRRLYHPQDHMLLWWNPKKHRYWLHFPFTSLRTVLMQWSLHRLHFVCSFCCLNIFLIRTLFLFFPPLQGLDQKRSQWERTALSYTLRATRSSSANLKQEIIFLGDHEDSVLQAESLMHPCPARTFHVLCIMFATRHRTCVFMASMQLVVHVTDVFVFFFLSTFR